MALRKAETWDRLSNAYRGRLERSGITRERYLSGEPLTGARGHARTPERPERAYKNPTAYPEYINKRRTGKVTVPTYDDNTVVRHIANLLMSQFAVEESQFQNKMFVQRLDIMTIREGVSRMDMQTRARAMAMTVEQLREEASIQVPKKYRKHPELWRRPIPWFYKDAEGQWNNPFWYH